MKLRAKLFIPIVIFSLLFIGFISFNWLPQVRQTIIERAEQDMSAHVRSVGNGLVPFLLQNQLASIYEEIDVLLEDNTEWMTVQVLNEFGTQIYPLSTYVPPEDTEMIISFSHSIGYMESPLGWISVSVDFTRVHEQSRQLMRNFLIAFTGFLVFFVVGVSIIIEKIISSRLHQLSVSASHIAEGDYEQPLPEVNNDEIGALSNSFAQMRIALKEHKDTLEKKVAERTAELKKAKIEAESASKEKSRFLANISHELRTPMHAILGFTELCLKKSDDDRIMEFLQKIKTSGYRLTGLINNLIELAEFESNKLVPEFDHHDLTIVIKQSVDALNSVLSKKNITVEINTDVPAEGIFDKNMIEQVIIHLLSNAIKFSPEGSAIKLNINSYMMVLDGKKRMVLSLVIKDQGVGIPEGELESVFEKFTQSSYTASNAGGTGLGLPICKQIINLHHGLIWAESLHEKMTKTNDNLSIGTSFHIVIPVVQLNHD